VNKNLLIIEPAYTGHHFALYLRLIIKATEGNFNLYLITTNNATNHPSYKIVETESKVNLKVFFIDELKESNKINSYSLLIRQIKLLSLFRKAVKNIITNVQIDHIYINNLDHCDKILPFFRNPFFGISYSGLLMSPKFHRFKCGIGSKSRSDIIYKILFKKLAQQNYIKNIFVIDELFYNYINTIHLSKNKIKFLYEPTNDISQNIGKEKSRISLKINLDKFCILIFGGITKRKGVIELINAIHSSKLENCCILIAGNIDNEIMEFLNSRISIDLIVNDKLKIFPGFKSEVEQDMFFESSDIVWVGYVGGFSASSGVFYQSGQYQKPVLSNNYGLLSYLVNKYNNGILCDVNNFDEINSSINLLANNSDCYQLYSQNSAKMTKLHNATDFGEKILRTIFYAN
jgi:glycosyltransferase involved in cell wall biosynthesis